MSIADPGPIPECLDRRHEAPTIWSHTFLNTYDDICQYQAFRRFIRRDIPFISTVAAERGKRVHEAMQRRILGTALPDEFRQFEKFVIPFDGKGIKPELKLGVTRQGRACDFFAKDVWGRGVIDVPWVNLERQTAYIGDWKTGKSAYEKPFELEIHAVLLHAKYPTLKVIKGQYIYLGENRTGEMYDLSDTMSTWKRINAIMSLVEADKRVSPAGIGFEKRQGPLCKWCDVKDCENNRKQTV